MHADFGETMTLTQLVLRPLSALVLLVALAVTMVNVSAAELTVTTPTGVTAEIEVLAWSGDARDFVRARLTAPGRTSIEPGRYALRLTGTDYRFGPVDLSALNQTVGLGSLTVRVPERAAPTTIYILDHDQGGVAAAIATDAVAAVLPGRFNLQRDLAETALPLDVSAGDVIEIDFAAVTVELPSDAGGAPVYLADPIDAIAAYGDPRAGAIAVAPGPYRVVGAEGNGGLPVFAEPGRIASVTPALIAVVPVGEGGTPFVVFDAATGDPVLSARTGDASHPLMVRDGTTLAMALSIGDWTTPEALAAAPRFLATAGEVTRFWQLPDNRLVGGRGDLEAGRLVEWRTNDDRLVVAGGEARLRLIAAEPSLADVTLVRIDGDDQVEVARAAQTAIAPPTSEIMIDIPADLPAGALLKAVADIERSDGSTLRGESRPTVVVVLDVAAPQDLAAAADGPTSVALTWAEAGGADFAGYQVWRQPTGRVPASGPLLLAETRFIDRGLSRGGAYAYTVCAVDSRGLAAACSASAEILIAE